MVETESRATLNTNKEPERILDTVMYLLCITESTFRFCKGYPPFDFMNSNTAEFLMNKNFAFLQDVDTPYEKAHEVFLMEMLQSGWVYGEEDFNEKRHPIPSPRPLRD